MASASIPEGQVTPFWRYVEEHGTEATAEQLSRLLGKQITVRAMQTYGRRSEPPKAWREALGLETPQPASSAEPPPDLGEPEGRQAETTPRPPESAKVIPLPVPTGEFAKKRISSAYQLIGAGISEGVGNPGVGKVWDDHSDPIAQAWLDAAESSDFARKFVQFMTAGGPMGEVVMLHVTMLAGTLYVIGQFPEVGFFGKYASYRPKQPAPGDEAAADDGAPREGAFRPVAAG